MNVGVIAGLTLLILLIVKMVVFRKKDVILSKRVQRWKDAGKYFQWRYPVFFRDSQTEPNPPKNHKEDSVLLLLHGFPTSSFDWLSVWGELLHESPISWRILAPDFIGFGFSGKPCERRLYQDGLVMQADMIEDFLKAEYPEGCPPVHILSHDYGLSVAQELIYRWQQPQRKGNYPPIQLRSVGFLNGGMIPGSHRPLLIQRLLASPVGYWLGMFMTKGMFGKRFCEIWGRKPTRAMMDDFWSLICYNEGIFVQAYLLSYMAESRKNCLRWITAIDNTFAPIPMILIDGPADPVSGRHLAEAVARHWKVEISEWGGECKPNIRQVQLLPNQFGHYPQVECSPLYWGAIFDSSKNVSCPPPKS